MAIHTNAQTTEITGADGKVNGLRYKDRATGVEHTVELDGVFVQIGLVPNTEWLKGTIELSRFGEIVVDAKGQTSVPGVFAAGDATTVPYKQIVIARWPKAALGAFDHLIATGRLVMGRRVSDHAAFFMRDSVQQLGLARDLQAVCCTRPSIRRCLHRSPTL